jgi:DNA primase catalytic core
MARIPEAEVERLKKEISVQRLAEARGMKLTRQGADLIGKCPFHDDRSPSLVITPAKNLWHCMGACNAGGDVIEWVMRAEGVSFRHAVELLRSEHLPSAASPIQLVKQSTVPKLPPPVAREADDRELLLQVVGYYSEALKQSPEALKYLASRGLQSSEIVDRFKLGFANRTLGYGLEGKNRVAGAEMRGRLQRLGILRESGHEHFNGSIVVPVFNASGEVVEMYGRKITARLREGTPLHLYLKGEHRGVWNEEALSASKEVILCEALIDALTFWCAGYRNVTASYGVNGFTADHRAAFEKHGTERVYIAYDNDEAGNKAAAKLAEELIELGLECFRVEFPKGMDANEYARKVTPAAKSLGVLLNRAAWLGKGQRSAVHAAVLEIVAEPNVEPLPAAAKAAAKEKIILEETPEPGPIQAPIAAAMPTTDAPAVEAPTEEVFSLAAVSVPAAPMPPRVESQGDVQVEVRGEDVLLKFGEREYRVRGLQKNLSAELLRVNIRVMATNARGEMGLHVDTLDLSVARPRTAFIKQAAEELGIKEEIVRRDVGKVLFKLEELRDEQIKEALQPKEKAVTLTDDERAEALELLRDPRLLERIVADFALCGVVGEETNKLVGYLGVVSRHLEAPLAVIVQSSSAAGKSSLMDAVLAFVPEEQRVQYSAMTGQSLFYMGETDLQHKVLAIVEEAGAQRASYALKLLQSEGELTIASTGKDPVSGRHVTHEYRVKGPVMIFLTTTAIDIDEELLNRCLVLTVNEDRAQTQAIHRVQREAQTIEGLLRRKDRDDLLRLHRNAQRLLKPVSVVNPYAPGLTFLDSQTRTRRDHTKYLTLIRTIALLHQHQRPAKEVQHNGKRLEYIEVTLDDIAVANRLTAEVLGRSLDELPPQTRRLLLLVDAMVAAECKRQQIERADFRFSRRDVRAVTGWGDTQLRLHLGRLEELEYLLAHRGGRGQSFVYELAFAIEGDGNRPVMPGLIDIENLGVAKLGGVPNDRSSSLGCLGGYKYDVNFAGLEDENAGSTRGQNGGVAGGSRGEESPVSIEVKGSFYGNEPKNTIKKETEITSVITMPHRSNGSMTGAVDMGVN